MSQIYDYDVRNKLTNNEVYNNDANIFSNIVSPVVNIYISKSTFINDKNRGECAFISYSKPFPKELSELVKHTPTAKWIDSLKTWEVCMPLVGVIIYKIKRGKAKLGITPNFIIEESLYNELKAKNNAMPINIRDLKWKTKPYEHQFEAIEYAIKHKRFILGDDSGCIDGDANISVIINGEKHTVKLSYLYALWKDTNDGEYIDIKVLRFNYSEFYYSYPQDVIDSGNKMCMELKVKGCEKLCLTADHPVLTTRGYVEAKNLQIDDEVIMQSVFNYRKRKVLSIKILGMKHVYDIKFLNPPHNFVANNIVVHNCGKTLEILDTIAYLKKFEGLKSALVICGINGNKYNWEEEVAIHTDFTAHILGSRRSKRTGRLNPGGLKETIEDLRDLPKADVYIINVERLRGGRRKRSRGQRKSISKFPVVELIQKHINDGTIGFVAFDECHKCKTPTSAQTQALLWINCPRQVAMTGTLIMNSPLDLYVPFKWMGWESRDYWQFLNQYAVKDMWGSVIGYQNAQELIDVLSFYQLRRLKNDVLDLPPKILHNEYVEFSDNEWKVYKAVQNGLMHLIQGDETDPKGLCKGLFIKSQSLDPMTLSLRLRQATADTSIVSDIIQESSKMNRMEELVEDVVNDGGKCIIFSNWTTVTAIARDRLAKYNPAYITGEIDQIKRNEERSRFQNDDSCKVIIGTIPAMGTGFTLTAANTVIFLDEPWTKASRTQAEDRGYRAGTKWKVDIYILMVKDTVDEHVHDVVEQKGDLSDLIVDGVVNPNKKEQLLRILIGCDPFKKQRRF